MVAAKKKVKRVASVPPTEWIEKVQQSYVDNLTALPEMRWVKVQKWMVFLKRGLGDRLVVGLDPGFASIGLALGSKKIIRVYQLDLLKEQIPDFPNQITYIRGLIHMLVLLEGLNNDSLKVQVGDQMKVAVDRAVVEGSAVMPFQESKLAGGRAAAIIGLSDAGLRVITAQPSELNKQVFGHAYHKAKDLWGKLLPKDAADATALCILAASKEWKR